MLLEWIAGRSAAQIADDEERTRVVARLIPRLHRPVPQGCQLPSVETWLEHLWEEPGARRLPVHLMEAAREMGRDLLRSSGVPVVLHGDLHPGNVLESSNRGWLVIDLKGVVGEACYEVGAIVRQPAVNQRQLTQRIDVLAAGLHVDRDRIRDWSFVQAVLAACWSLEDGNTSWEWYVKCAESLRRVRA